MKPPVIWDCAERVVSLSGISSGGWHCLCYGSQGMAGKGTDVLG